MFTNVRDLGAVFHQRRADLGLTQAQTAEKAGVARSWLARVEAGQHPRAEVQKVLDLAYALGMAFQVVPDPDVGGEDPFQDVFGT